jgi:cephalosporin hydroxylase
MSEFTDEMNKRIEENGKDFQIKTEVSDFLVSSVKRKYSYNFSWLGRPIIQYPQDIVALQEIIWKVKPDLIIETGIAHGGSLIFSASMLELNAICGGCSNSMVLGIDVEIRKPNKEAIESHPLHRRISMIEGDSISSDVIDQVYEIAKEKNNILVILDSNHTHDHVLAELQAYSQLTSKGSYCIVFDTFIEDMPNECYPDRPWGKGNNPKTAVWGFLKTTDRFVIDKEIENKLLITVSPDGYLKRIK